MSTDTRTSFARWRAALGFTIRQAADALGISPAQVKRYQRGTDERGNPALLDRRTRLAMAAVSAGIAPHDPERDEINAILQAGDHASRRAPQAAWFRGRWILTHPEIPPIVYDPATREAEALSPSPGAPKRRRDC